MQSSRASLRAPVAEGRPPLLAKVPTLVSRIAAERPWYRTDFTHCRELRTGVVYEVVARMRSPDGPTVLYPYSGAPHTVAAPRDATPDMLALQYEPVVPCEDCEGTGRISTSDGRFTRECSVCDGTGYVAGER